MLIACVLYLPSVFLDKITSNNGKNEKKVPRVFRLLSLNFINQEFNPLSSCLDLELPHLSNSAPEDLHVSKVGLHHFYVLCYITFHLLSSMNLAQTNRSVPLAMLS